MAPPHWSTAGHAERRHAKLTAHSGGRASEGPPAERESARPESNIIEQNRPGLASLRLASRLCWSATWLITSFHSRMSTTAAAPPSAGASSFSVNSHLPAHASNSFSACAGGRTESQGEQTGGVTAPAAEPAVWCDRPGALSCQLLRRQGRQKWTDGIPYDPMGSHTIRWDPIRSDGIPSDPMRRS